MTSIERLLDRIDQLDQNATDGPWTAHKDYRGLGGGCVYEPSGYPLPGCFNCGENDAIYEGIDAEFIAEARTALPQLATALKAVLSKCASMERGVGYRVSGQHDTWDSYHEGMSDMAGYIEETITDALEGDHD